MQRSWPLKPSEPMPPLGANLTVYQLLGITREVPPIHGHDKALKVKLDAVVKAFR